MGVGVWGGCVWGGGGCRGGVCVWGGGRVRNSGVFFLAAIEGPALSPPLWNYGARQREDRASQHGSFSCPLLLSPSVVLGDVLYPYPFPLRFVFSLPNIKNKKSLAAPNTCAGVMIRSGDAYIQ